VKDGHAIVVDAAGSLYLFDAQTGAPEGTVATRRGAVGGCIVTDGTERMMIGTGAFFPDANSLPALFPWELDAAQASFFDPATRRLTPAPLGREYCVETPYCATKAAGPRGDYCEELTRGQDRARLPASLAGGSTRFRAGDRMVAVTRALDRVVAFDPTTGSTAWEAPGSAPELRRAEWSPVFPSYALSKRAFFMGYQALDLGATRTPLGTLRYVVVGIDLATGKTLFAGALPRSDLGTSVPYLAADEEDVFAPMDDELLVIDARAGVVRGRIGAP
jgi:outer membrane protein assembly factor BamB